MTIPNSRMRGATRVSRGGLPWGHDPLTGDVGYEADEVEFANAMEYYRRTRHRKFPTCAEILAVLKALGYQKVGPAGPPPRYTPPAE